MDPKEAIWRMRSTALEVIAMGHLIKWQQLDVVATEDVQVGIGENLARLGNRLRRLAEKLEYMQLEETKTGGKL
jgi:hypothetical protein